MATTEDQKNGGNGKDMKGKACPCGCDNCGCTGWNGPWGHHHWGGFWLVRIVIALILLGVAFSVGVMVGRFHEGFYHRGYMMPYGYYGQAYPGMMGGYGAGGTRGAIPPVPTNGAAGASGGATAPAASSTLR